MGERAGDGRMVGAGERDGGMPGRTLCVGGRAGDVGGREPGAGDLAGCIDGRVPGAGERLPCIMGRVGGIGLRRPLWALVLDARLSCQMEAQGCAEAEVAVVVPSAWTDP